MEIRKVVIAGGSGFLGTLVRKHFSARGIEVVILSRGKSRTLTDHRIVHWDGKNPGAWMKEIDGTDVLINFAGKSVNCRYTEKNKAEITGSRVRSVELLRKAINVSATKPKLWIQAGSATIYRHSLDKPMTEKDEEFMENDFSTGVCQAWERSFYAWPDHGIRKAFLRISFVLSPDGEALPAYLRLARMGLGGVQGNGRQMMSWIHAMDFVNLLTFIIQREDLSGTFNVASPGPVTNFGFMKAVRHLAGIPFGIDQPAWLLEAGAFLLGTETELVLKSRWVIPGRLIRAGFRFRYPDLPSALASFARKPRRMPVLK